MLSDRHTRILLITLMGLVILASLVLAMSITGLQLRAGIEFPPRVESDTPVTSSSPGSSTQPRSLNFLQAAAAIIFLGLVIYLGVRVVKLLVLHSAQWKGIWKIIVALAGVVLIMIFLGNLTPASNYPSSNDDVFQTSTPSAPLQGVAVGEPPQSLRWLFLAILFSGLGLLAFIGSRKKLGLKRLDPIVQNAEGALESLFRGDDFRNVILRCYYEMSRVIQEENGIERESVMTVREFEVALDLRGFDLEPIHQLGVLFEKARYSDQPITGAEEEQGLACLQRIAGRKRNGERS